MTTPPLTITPSFQPHSIHQLSYATPPLCGPCEHEWGMQPQSVHCRNARLVSCPLPLIWCHFTDLQMCKGPVQHMNTSPPTYACQNNRPLAEHHPLFCYQSHFSVINPTIRLSIPLFVQSHYYYSCHHPGMVIHSTIASFSMIWRPRAFFWLPYVVYRLYYITIYIGQFL